MRVDRAGCGTRRNGDLRSSPQGDFVHVRLTQPDGAGFCQALYHDRILIRHMIGKEERPRCGAHPGGFNLILECQRDTV